MPDQGQKGRAPHRSAVPKLAIATLGAFAAYAGGREVRIGNRKSRALVAYLALSEAGEQTRERLVGILWSETEEAKARASLRQALYEIREALSAAGFDGLKSDKLSVTLDRSAISVDLVDVLDQARDGRAHPILLERQRLLDTLLEEFETIDPAFRVWLLAKRQSFHDRIVRLLETALRGQSTEQGGQRELALALINLDPTHEEAARTLIRAHVAEGDIGAALRVYKALWDLLEEEYDVEPSKETQELIAAVKMADQIGTGIPAERREATQIVSVVSTEVPVQNRPQELQKPAASKLILGVADFDALQISEGRRHLVQGFRRELMACLVRFREWLVRDLTILPRGQRAIQQMPGEYVIDASVHEDDGLLRLVLMLRDVETSDHLWSERLQLSLDNWFTNLEFVVRRITTALNVHLSIERMASLAQRQVSDMKAYDLWLLGQATLLRWDTSSWEKARQIFRGVIAELPEFAPAYSSLAQLNNGIHIAMPGIFREADRTDEALQYAREAARLDPIDSRSQLCLGWSHALSKHYDQASIFMSLAQELNENDPWTMISSANCLAFCGEYAKASESAEHALRLPLAPSPLQWSYHTAIRFMIGDYRRCIEAADAAGDTVNPNVPGWKVAALSHTDDRAAAKDELQRFFSLTRKRWVGKEPASDEVITRWLLHLFPIRRPDDWERFRDGLAEAGAPVGDFAHHQW